MSVKSSSTEILHTIAMPRRPELDALRGLFLVWMTLTHLPTHMSDVVNTPFGYVTSADGFVFLSAILVSQVYLRRSADVRAESLKLPRIRRRQEAAALRRHRRRLRPTARC